MNVMDDDMFSVPANCTVGNVIELLELTKNRQINFPIVQDMKSMKLLGSVKRRELFAYLHLTFEKMKKIDDLMTLLPVDAEDFDMMAKKEHLETTRSIGEMFRVIRNKSLSVAMKQFRATENSSPEIVSTSPRNTSGATNEGLLSHYINNNDSFICSSHKASSSTVHSKYSASLIKSHQEMPAVVS
jgi:hypothetical protein